MLTCCDRPQGWAIHRFQAKRQAQRETDRDQARFLEEAARTNQGGGIADQCSETEQKQQHWPNHPCLERAPPRPGCPWANKHREAYDVGSNYSSIYWSTGQNYGYERRVRINSRLDMGSKPFSCSTNRCISENQTRQEKQRTRKSESVVIWA